MTSAFLAISSHLLSPSSLQPLSDQLYLHLNRICLPTFTCLLRPSLIFLLPALCVMSGPPVPLYLPPLLTQASPSNIPSVWQWCYCSLGFKICVRWVEKYLSEKPKGVNSVTGHIIRGSSQASGHSFKVFLKEMPQYFIQTLQLQQTHTNIFSAAPPSCSQTSFFFLSFLLSSPQHSTLHNHAAGQNKHTIVCISTWDHILLCACASACGCYEAGLFWNHCCIMCWWVPRSRKMWQTVLSSCAVNMLDILHCHDKNY